MEKIVSNVEKHYVAVKLSATNHENVLDEMAGTLFCEGYVTDGFRDAIIEREKNFPTGLPTGDINVAIPHASPEFVKEPAICLGVLDQPVEFEVMGMEGEKVQVSVLFMLAIKKKEEQLGLLQKLIATCQNQEILSVLKTGDAEKIDEVLGDLIS
ncbi:MAG: PTS sugar transporter subunit IIA [Anaerostipes sp.]|nr:PTS sugar transporter subunit IIA [Anaerostipes sp.]MDD3746010.1 PTS sugar transporter subunit IIA [Anaerostipes sp.]